MGEMGKSDPKGPYVSAAPLRAEPLLLTRLWCWLACQGDSDSDSESDTDSDEDGMADGMEQGEVKFTGEEGGYNPKEFEHLDVAEEVTGLPPFSVVSTCLCPW